MSSQPVHVLTYQDFTTFPDDGLHEIVDGALFVKGVPSLRHQKVSGELFLQLREQVTQPGRGEVYYSPVGVELSPHDIVQPDLVVVLDRSVLVGSHVRGTPELVVEILSPSNRRHDLETKHELYERSGVGEHWVLDAEGRALTQHVLEGGRYRCTGDHREHVSSVAVDGLDVDLSRVW
ncbi:MAG: Uma2 family endonuclease [Acidobacteriota bacterium]